ncbi:MAG: hypothetical protein ABIU05_16915 [Nitrospirales bacterium]
MGYDESVTRQGGVRAPRHRADCVDFYLRPQDTELLDLRMPPDIISVLEDAAQQANRTWAAQIIYVIEVCEGRYVPSADDRRTVQDWQALMAKAKMQLNEGEDWIPLQAFFNTAGTQPGGAV